MQIFDYNNKKLTESFRCAISISLEKQIYKEIIVEFNSVIVKRNRKFF
jgi:hypothetical protein